MGSREGCVCACCTRECVSVRFSWVTPSITWNNTSPVKSSATTAPNDQISILGVVLGEIVSSCGASHVGSAFESLEVGLRPRGDNPQALTFGPYGNPSITSGARYLLARTCEVVFG